MNFSGKFRSVQGRCSRYAQAMLVTTNPAILYFGTPVVLVSSINPDGSANLAPMSSAWWLGWRCMLGFGARSATPQNILRTGECVLNLPSAAMAGNVNRLALTTASDPVPEFKQKRSYRHLADKFGRAGLTQVASEIVAAPRALECPIQLEARLADPHRMAEDNPSQRGNLIALELEIVRVHADSSVLVPGEPDRIDPDRWRPLIMSFQHFYGLTPRLRDSTLASIPESSYRPQPAPSVEQTTSLAGR
jgi:flavin reductase (DIM6/NTAB) family NADH-FMN oxidoreductase RutF